MTKVESCGSCSANERASQIVLPGLKLADIPENLYAGREPINHSRFPSRVVTASRFCLPLRGGSGNAKMGDDTFQRGRWRGKRSFFLALEEGATCPATCIVRQIGLCGAANFAGLRFAVNDALYAWIEFQLGCATRQHAAGVAVRLHVSGDFPDEHHVRFLGQMLHRFPSLCVWGHSHAEVLYPLICEQLNDAYPGRALIRGSEFMAPHRTVTVLRTSQARCARVPLCPATLTAAPGGPRLKRHGEKPLTDCARCGMCMNPNVSILAWPLSLNGVGYAEGRQAELRRFEPSRTIEPSSGAAQRQ